MLVYSQTILYYIYYITIKESTMLVETDEKIQERIARQNENTMKFQAKMYTVLGVFFIGVIIVDAIFF